MSTATDEGWTKNDQEQEPEPVYRATGRLLHYSSRPIESLKNREQSANARRERGDKPWGLWLSVEGDSDWRSWCEEESFGNVAEQLCYVVTLADGANILRITTEDELLAFDELYGYDPYGGRYSFRGRGIQWERVAQEYDGIIIAPYIWELRLDSRTEWYYGWDCASGCVWNARAITGLSLCANGSDSTSVVLAVDPSWSTPPAAALAPIAAPPTEQADGN